MLIWMPWHISLGFALLGLILLRVVARMLPPVRTRSSGLVATAMHVSLYLVLLAATLSGWFAYRIEPLMPAPRLFGIIPLQPIHLPFGAPWTAWHKALVWLLLALVGGHIAAAAYHLLVLKDRIFQAMMFGPTHPSR